MTGSGTAFGSGIRVKQLGEARILGQVLEVGVVASLKAESRVQADGFIQTAQGVLDVAGHTVQSGDAVNHIVGFRRLLLEFFKVLAGLNVVAQVHERDGIVEMLFRGFEVVVDLFQMLGAGTHVHGGAVGEFLAGAANNLLKMGLGLIELVLLQGAQAGLVVLDGLRKAGIVSHGLFGGRFLSHLQHSSCAFRNYSLMCNLR